MKFLKGLLIGGAIGFGIGAALNEQQRKQITASVKKKAAPIGDSVKSNVSQVADTVVDGVTSKIDDAGDTVADKVNAAP